MANLFVNLPMPVGDGPGPSVNTSAMGKEKSIVVGGSFPGASVAVEASTDGVIFQPIQSFPTASSKKVIPVAAQFMRVFVRGRSAQPFNATTNVGANDNGALFVGLPLPAGDGPGAPVNVAALGNFTTFVIGGPFEGTSVEVQASEDGVDFFPCVSFGDGRAELQSRSVVADFFRTFVRGRVGNSNPFAPIVSVGAINDAGGAATFGVPITVRGPTNAGGISDLHTREDHQHRLEYEVEDEGVLVSARPRMDVVGDGVGVVDVPGEDLTRMTIPGPNLGDGGAVVKRSQYVAASASTSGNVFVDGMAGLSVAVPIDGNYCAIWEGEFHNDSASTVLEVGVSVNSLVAVVANSERKSQGNANDVGAFITSIDLGALTAGDLIRGLIRKSAGSPPSSVSVIRRNLTIIKYQ